MLGILWKDLKVMRMQTAILTSIFLMMTVASVWNTGRQDDISFFLNFSTLMPIFFTLLPCSALALEQQEQTNAWLMTLPCSRKQMVLEKYVLLLVFGFSGSSWDYHSDFNRKCVIICVGNAFRHLGNLFSVRFAAVVL